MGFRKCHICLQTKSFKTLLYFVIHLFTLLYLIAYSIKKFKYTQSFICSRKEFCEHINYFPVVTVFFTSTTGEKPASSASLSLSVSSSGSSLPGGAFFPCRSREARAAGTHQARGQTWMARNGEWRHLGGSSCI